MRAETSDDHLAHDLAVVDDQNLGHASSGEPFRKPAVYVCARAIFTRAPTPGWVSDRLGEPLIAKDGTQGHLCLIPSTAPPSGLSTTTRSKREHARRALAVDFDTEVFADGSAVLERLANGSAPDVLVLDWLMPGVTGIEVCKYLRSSRRPSRRRCCS